jgi:hypothetical protein
MPRTALIRACVGFALHGTLAFAQSEWTLRSLDTSSSFSSIAYDGKTFLAALYSRDVYASTDGLAWNQVGTHIGQYVRHAGNYFFAFMPWFRTSKDGISWEVQEIDRNNSSPDLRDVAYNGSLYVAVGWDDNQDSALLITSPDAIRWTRLPVSGVYRSLLSVTWTGTRFVVVGESMGAAGDSTGAVTGNPGPILTSEDGRTWTRRKTVTPFDVSKVIWTGKRVVAICGDLMTSPDGIDWRLHHRSHSYYHFDALAHNGDQVVAFAPDSLWISDGGQGWIARPSFAPKATIRDAIFTGKLFLAAGDSGRFYTAPVDPTLAVRPFRTVRASAAPWLPGLFPFQGRVRDARGLAR